MAFKSKYSGKISGVPHIQKDVKDNTAAIPKSTNEMIKALRLALEDQKRYIHGVRGFLFPATLKNTLKNIGRKIKYKRLWPSVRMATETFPKFKQTTFRILR